MNEMNKAIQEVVAEFVLACNKFPEFNSSHEGYSVILEELDELWEEVKKRPDMRDVKILRAEAKQVAAMALRFMVDLT